MLYLQSILHLSAVCLVVGHMHLNRQAVHEMNTVENVLPPRCLLQLMLTFKERLLYWLEIHCFFYSRSVNFFLPQTLLFSYIQFEGVFYFFVLN